MFDWRSAMKMQEEIKALISANATGLDPEVLSSISNEMVLFVQKKVFESHVTKISFETCREIKGKWNSGDYTQAELAVRYNLSVGMIQKICNDKLIKV